MVFFFAEPILFALRILFFVVVRCLHNSYFIPVSANPTKWSNTLKQFKTNVTDVVNMTNNNVNVCYQEVLALKGRKA